MKATCVDVRETVVAIVCCWPLFVVVLLVIVIVCDVRAVSLYVTKWCHVILRAMLYLLAEPFLL